MRCKFVRLLSSIKKSRCIINNVVYFFIASLFLRFLFFVVVNLHMLKKYVENVSGGHFAFLTSMLKLKKFQRPLSCN